MRSVRVIIAGAVFMLGACGQSTESKTEPPPVKETVFGDMVGTMDRAKGVQDTVMQDKQHVDEAIEAADSKKPE
jgi:hypothetical protein